MHDADLGAELREEDRLLHRAVAAADHDDRAVLEERGVAGGAVGDAAAAQLLLAGHAELLVLGTHREDDGAGAVRLVADPDGVQVTRLGAEVDLRREVRDEARAEALGLVAHCCMSAGPMIPVGKPG